MPKGRNHQKEGSEEMVLVPRVQLDELIDEMRELRRDLYELRHPVLVSPAYLAWMRDCSEKTIMRRVDAWGIPRRDLRGNRKTSDAGPTRICLQEWEKEATLPDTVVVRQQRRYNACAERLKRKGVT